ncbi:MAG: glycosyltransferase family 39 protein [Patescibacteria group bacterium]
MGKINGKVISIIWLLTIGLLVYSRFVNLGWGLPYPMHPDERNMASAIQGLNCIISNFRECGNPHFFAYGQFPLYLGYLIAYLLKLEATISLRIISAVASVINAIIIIKIIKFIIKKESYFTLFISYIIIIFSPYAIQFSHFGTTESLLMLFYSLIVYLSMQMLERRTTVSVIWLALVSGLAVATKVSSMIFIVVPLITILSSLRSWDGYKNLIKFGVLAIISVVLFSPHNFLNFRDFISSMNYESDVALGKSLVFYTRQFFGTEPFYFQLTKIFPYALGWPAFILGGLGFLGLSWRDKKNNLLRFAFLIYFIPTAMISAKWSRFMSPIFPLMTIFTILFLHNIIQRFNQRLWIPAFAGMTLILIIPGISYLHIYQNPDVRFTASNWIYKNIPNNSYILSETANVVDIPISNGYSVISFNFYDLDESPELQSELKVHLKKADYIFIPSRRIFANHPKEQNPILNKYYEGLFSGKLGFVKVAEFNSFPKIRLFGQTLIEFPDEDAEETWTVFDHPLIRIYKRIAKNPKL